MEHVPVSVPALLMILFFIGMPILLVRAGIKSVRRMRENFARLATNLQLQLDPPEPPSGWFSALPSVIGQRRGKQVRIHTYSTGSGKSRRTWTAAAVTPAMTGGLTFSFTRQGFGSKLGQLFGAKEITVGNREFDDAWFIATNEPDFLRAALLPELQQKFRPFRGSFKLEKGVVTYVEQGNLVGDERRHRYELAVELACNLADIAEVQARHAGAR